MDIISLWGYRAGCDERLLSATIRVSIYLNIVIGDQDGGGRDWNTLRRQWPLARGGGEDWPAAGMVQPLPAQQRGFQIHRLDILTPIGSTSRHGDDLL